MNEKIFIKIPGTDEILATPETEEMDDLPSNCAECPFSKTTEELGIAPAKDRRATHSKFK